ncbi:hypothetical protein HMPREF1162_2361 [ [[Propionibacterium] namnetense SK182B-JCVI]|uniref:Uncharacterized protein n=1 Tax=[Propionibacterium] namnetense SK182B-JCVI TaxID=1051006 RepID=F9NVP3_9ACTN|nr:hypothetical protein HMPREF9616_01370 [Cutibacterium acnes HL007PA1]EGE92931.1 hypothetical protein HMPREF9571_01388 [Cutibacterium acnes HL043PA2]EGR96951.1 hypothetical protein HMPREF1162_2361 [ [[Propionibacterium] namnetense SK182B-JCVI]PGF31425.1 hypothetical protein B1B11_12800 [Cutibacterium acnes subsp. acnes]
MRRIEAQLYLQPEPSTRCAVASSDGEDGMARFTVTPFTAWNGGLRTCPVRAIITITSTKITG